MLPSTKARFEKIEDRLDRLERNTRVYSFSKGQNYPYYVPIGELMIKLLKKLGLEVSFTKYVPESFDLKHSEEPSDGSTSD